MTSMEDDASPAPLSEVRRVVSQPLQFKAKLGIGEDAYSSLQAGRAVGELWHVGTAAAAGGVAAGSSAVASTFFGTWLTALGIGTAVTPIGWVIGGAAAAGALSWGALRAWRSYSGSRVEAVPRFINTPIDYLAASLFDLIGGLSIIVAREAGGLDEAERAAVMDYFQGEWGIDPEYIAAALPALEESTLGASVRDAAKALAEYKRNNPDCDYEAMSAEVLRFLKEIAEADGALDAAELDAIAAVEATLREENSWGVWKAATSAASVISEAPKAFYQRAFSSGAPGAAAEAVPLAPVRLPVPTLWLLGKTGAGKSSLVQALTCAGSAEIGNGFASCTRTASSYDFPPNEPVMRFLDTRGLGEIDYDPSDDLAEIERSAHVALVLLRLDDPVQGVVADTLSRIRKRTGKLPVILIHTAADMVPDEQARIRVLASNQRAMAAAWGPDLPAVTLDLSKPREADLSALTTELVGLLPSVAMFLAAEEASNDEELEFAKHRTLVLGYAGSATATGALPVVGVAAVPTLQIAMLSALAGRYGIEWSSRRLAELAAGLGLGVLGGQAIALAAREAAMFVPIVGQTLAPVAAATWGFSSTFALGRTAAWWFHNLRKGNPIDEAELRNRFQSAFKRAVTDRD